MRVKPMTSLEKMYAGIVLFAYTVDEQTHKFSVFVYQLHALLCTVSLSVVTVIWW